MSKTVLSVDDEDHIREFVSTVLEENGYTPILATNGEEAMDIIRQQKPDLIIMDILMPKESGIKLYRELKTSEGLKGIPVIIYSGVAKRTALRAQAAQTESGGESVPDPDAYLEKPVTAKHLASTIKKVLG
ncbi:MAG: response regulator [Proteobacteria bacterium]|nr:response regulator [Pseudomonadota bacterium]MCK4485699.1 response regulator [Desulfobacterales bacterium]